MSETMILLFPIDTHERREANQYEDRKLTEGELNALKVAYPDIERYTLTDFMELCNDEYFFPDNYWVSYVHIIDVTDTLKEGIKVMEETNKLLKG